MTIWIAFLSILTITACAAIARRLFRSTLCPICVGVSVTWAILLAYSFMYPGVDLRVVAILMGGSIVGIAYKSEEFLPNHRSPMFWKALVIPCGFVLVFSVIDRAWWMTMTSGAGLTIIALWFFMPWLTTRTQTHTEKIKSLEEKMKKCC